MSLLVGSNPTLSAIEWQGPPERAFFMPPVKQGRRSCRLDARACCDYITLDEALFLFSKGKPRNLPAGRTAKRQSGSGNFKIPAGIF